MSDVLKFVREDLREFSGYASARRTGLNGKIFLNANESPWPPALNPAQGLNRYPQQQPEPLRARLAALYQLGPEQLLLTRGSDEAIDLLVRSACRAYQDAIITTPPTFGMYSVCARIQAARVLEVPLLERGDTWRADFAGILSAVRANPVKIIFLCSPGNPVGAAIDAGELAEFLTLLDGRALVVVDEAYGEYMASQSAIGLLSSFENVLVLRTLSKAFALAAARIGVVMGDPELISVLRAIAPPYPLSSLATDAASAALTEESVQVAMQRIAQIVVERDRLRAELLQLRFVRQVYASDANFLLLRLERCEDVFKRLLASGIVVRDMRSMPGLEDALRISIGSPDENEQLLEVMQALQMEVA